MMDYALSAFADGVLLHSARKLCPLYDVHSRGGLADFVSSGKAAFFTPGKTVISQSSIPH
jgi:hypothetical protein